jgi:hypothetical protein
MGATFFARIQPQPCENALCGKRKARQNAIGISQLKSLLFIIQKSFLLMPVLSDTEFPA